jgi:hypothetical protein
MSFTPSAAAQAIAALAGNNLAALAAPLAALQASIGGGNLGPAAWVDALLSSLGYQAQSVAMSTAATTTSASFVDAAGWSTFTFNAPIAKTYVVHVDLAVFLSAGNGYAYFQLVNTTTSTNYAPADAVVYLPSGLTVAATQLSVPKSFRIPVAMSAGNNVLKLQWKQSGGATIGTDTTSTPRTFTVTG